MWHHSRTRGFAIALVFAVIIAVLATGCAGKNAGGDKGDVVAEYKDGTVTKQEYDTFWGVMKLLNPLYAQYESDPQFREEVLKQLIATKILYARADEETKQKAEDTAKEQLEQFKELSKNQLSPGETFEGILKEYQVSEDDLRDYMARMMAVWEDAKQSFTDEELKQKYDETLKENKHAFTTAAVRHILIAFETPDGTKRSKEDALKRAEEVRSKLKQSGNFDELAKQYSDDIGSKENGGKVEDYVNAWVEPFRDAALQLPLNQISEPVETEYGYHILKVEKRTEQTFDDVKEQLRETAVNDRLQQFSEKELPDLITSINLPEPNKQAPSQKDSSSGQENPKS